MGLFSIGLGCVSLVAAEGWLVGLGAIVLHVAILHGGIIARPKQRRRT